MTTAKKQTEPVRKKVGTAKGFAIYEGVPTPPARKGHGRVSKYPFDALKVGQHTVLPFPSRASEEVKHKLLRNIRNTVGVMSRKNKINGVNIQLVARMTDEGVGVWCQVFGEF